MLRKHSEVDLFLFLLLYWGEDERTHVQVGERKVPLYFGCLLEDIRLKNILLDFLSLLLGLLYLFHLTQLWNLHQLPLGLSLLHAFLALSPVLSCLIKFLLLPGVLPLPFQILAGEVIKKFPFKGGHFGNEIDIFVLKLCPNFAIPKWTLTYF